VITAVLITVAPKHWQQRLSFASVVVAGPEETTAALVIRADIVVGVVVRAKAAAASLTLRGGAGVIVGVVF
jgi:hypothetical protein